MTAGPAVAFKHFKCTGGGGNKAMFLNFKQLFYVESRNSGKMPIGLAESFWHARGLAFA